MAVRTAGLVVTAAPRAVGVRTPWSGVPERVRSWVERELGSPVVETADQVGGMSPGCATRLRCADGTRAFVKAVGADLNPHTPTLFRREVRTLGLIGAHRLWARLLASLDEGESREDGWVALLLEDVPGLHPDLSTDAARDRLTAATDELGAVLRERVPALPAPDPARGLAEIAGERAVVEAWSHGLDHAAEVAAEAPDLMPRWVGERADELRDAVRRLAQACTEDRLAHWDIRDDNLRTRADGSIVFVDWGGTLRGSAWTDPLIARLEGVELDWFDRSVAGSPALQDLGEDLVTAFLVMIGSWLGYRAHTAVDMNLPTLNAFRRTESARFLLGAGRRLGETARRSI